MIRRRAFIYSLGISLSVHILFLLISLVLKIQPIKLTFDKEKKFFNVKVAKEKVEAKKISRMPTPKAKELKFEAPKYISSVESFVDNVQKKVQKESIEIVQAKQKNPIITYWNENLYNEIDVIKDNTMLENKRLRQIRDNIIAHAEVSDEKLKDRKEVAAQGREDEHYRFDRVTGFSPDFSPGEVVSLSDSDIYDLAGLKSSVIQKKITDILDLSKDFVWNLETYTDRKTKEKYFKLSIRTGVGAQSMKTIPKQMIFLLDASNSIKEPRMNQFKEGLKYCLALLNSDDIFNIIVFKERIIKFKRKSVKPTHQVIGEALSFIDALKFGGRTDTSNALNTTIKKEITRQPSYILLLSDGLPTKGVTNPREVINRVADFNKGKTSIFTFSGGIQVNRYLLDFIAFKNRGWSEHSGRVNYIEKKMRKMYYKIVDPILLDMRYFVSGISKDEIFPKMLPDFFRNAEFILYGKYKDEDKFVVQLLGETDDGKVNEYVIEGNFQESLQGDKEIAKNWAFNKVYHLIGQLKSNQDNTQLLEQITSIAKEYNLKMPYLKYILQ